MLGRTLVVTGEVRASEDLTVEGTVTGPVFCDGQALVIGSSATVTGDVIARDVTVLGRAVGQLIATDVVDVRAGAVAQGHVMAPRFILHEDASFNGRVEPQHLEAALRVAKFQQKKRSVG